MINFLKKLFKPAPAVDYKDLIKNGAQIIDVRTPGEYASGHIDKSVNIPLNTLKSNVSKIKKNVPLITICASGMRSASAKNTLIKMGFSNVYNAGSWHTLRNKIQ